MASFVVVLWLIGLAGAGVITVAVVSDNPRIVRLGRIGFAALLAVELFAGVVVFTIGQANASPGLRTTQSMWWLFALGGGVPLAFASGLIVRRGFAGHRLVLWSAVTLTAALWLVFPFAFTPAGQELQGLGRFVHTHHALTIVALLLPSLIVLVGELFRGGEMTDAPTIATVIRRAPRRVTIGIAVGVVALIWVVGVSATVFWLTVAVVLVVGGVIVGLKSRAEVREVHHDLS